MLTLLRLVLLVSPLLSFLLAKELPVTKELGKRLDSQPERSSVEARLEADDDRPDPMALQFVVMSQEPASEAAITHYKIALPKGASEPVLPMELLPLNQPHLVNEPRRHRRRFRFDLKRRWNKLCQRVKRFFTSRRNQHGGDNAQPQQPPQQPQPPPNEFWIGDGCEDVKLWSRIPKHQQFISSANPQEVATYKLQTDGSHRSNIFVEVKHDGVPYKVHWVVLKELRDYPDLNMVLSGMLSRNGSPIALYELGATLDGDQLKEILVSHTQLGTVAAGQSMEALTLLAGMVLFDESF